MGLFFKAPQFYYNFLNPEQKRVYFIDKPLYKRHYSTTSQKKIPDFKLLLLVLQIR